MANFQVLKFIAHLTDENRLGSSLIDLLEEKMIRKINLCYFEFSTTLGRFKKMTQEGAARFTAQRSPRN